MKRIYPWLLVILIDVFWLWRLDSFPGLHADEAWGGLKAYAFLTTGHTDAFGMNRYTGAMHSLLVALCFKTFGLHVFSLRISGALFNTLGLCLLVSMLWKIKKPVASMLLLLLLQSAVWMLYPRIAWEVCSFTLFFMALFLFIGKKVHTEAHPKAIWAFLFFMVGILSSYNHILFSCVSLAYLLTCLMVAVLKGMWSWRRLYAPVVNMANSSLLFCCMNAFEGLLLREHPFIVLLSFILLCAIEAMLLGFIPYKTIRFAMLGVKQKVAVLSVLAALALIPFLYLHGGAMLDSLTSAKVFQHVLGRPFHGVFTAFSLAMAFLVVGAFLFFLLTDVKNAKISSLVLFILCYMGLLPVYTPVNSTRYYLVLHLCVFLYLAIKVAKTRRSFLYMSLMAIGGLWNIFFLISTYLHQQDVFEGRDMYFGSRYETSNHFKPLAPLLDSLRKYHIEDIRYADGDSRYFLEQPLKFMELVQPWDKEAGAAVVIDYGNTAKNGGFIWMRTDEK